MITKMFEQYRRALLPIALLSLALGFTPDRAQANVCATNIRLSGGTTNLTVAPGTPLEISYTLNETAAQGVTVEITSAGTVVRTLTFAGGAPGTQPGVNTISWDGLDNQSNSLPFGTYSVRITARTGGYTSWTQISDDTNPGNYVYDGRGIAIDRNTNSPYYGRIYIANAFSGPSPGTTYGDNLGILVFNADASIADTNISSDGGYTWSGNDVSPWKVEVGNDDSVYVGEALNGGHVFRWDANLTSASFLPVLRADNQPAGASLSGPFIVGGGANAQVWMCDTNTGSPASLGVLRWLADANGACATNDTGQAIVGRGSSLTVAPFDVALDKAGNIYLCQFTSTSADPIPRVFRFPAYDPATNAGLPETTATWAVGSGNDTYGQASGIAVDPTGTYVAVAFQGASPDGSITNGNTKILSAATGAVVTNLDLGVEFNGIPTHQDTDCAWDAVGNVYYLDNWFGVWRAVSPPGPNASVTVAAVTLRIGNPQPPQFTSMSVSNGLAILQFTGAPTDTPSQFTLQSAPLPGGTFTNASAAQIVQPAPGRFQASVPVDGPALFYRLQK